MWCKRDWIVSPSNKGSSISPVLHKSILLSFWRRRLVVICMTLKMISLCGQLFVQHPSVFLDNLLQVLFSLFDVCVFLTDSCVLALLWLVFCSEDHLLFLNLLADYQWLLHLSFSSNKFKDVDVFHDMWRNFVLCKMSTESSHFASFIFHVKEFDFY